MTVETITAVLLIAVPIAFNLAFFELGRTFDYPNILRKEPDEILRRFDAGGSGLILRWEALLVSALLMLPIAALLAVVLAASPALSVLSVVVGATAAIVQGLGLVRWPFAVPELARRYVAAPHGPQGDATRKTVEVVFATLHRLLGVGIGEHLERERVGRRPRLGRTGGAARAAGFGEDQAASRRAARRWAANASPSSADW